MPQERHSLTLNCLITPISAVPRLVFRWAFCCSWIVSDLWHDLRAVTREIRPGWDLDGTPALF